VIGKCKLSNCSSISWREHIHLYHGENIYIYIMARTFTSISWREHIHLYHGESIYIYIMVRAYTSISWREHLHLYHGESIYIYITDLVCYTYFHWFFIPECQHIFGKQTGYIFQSPKTIKTWTTKHYALMNRWYNTE
jgi:hypothetical protein